MIGITEAIAILKGRGVKDCFELSGVLTIPCESVEELYDTAEKVRKIFKEVGFEKSWRVDPYYYENRKTLKAAMFDENSQNLQSL